MAARGAAAACVAARDSGAAPANEKMGTVERAADDGSTPRAAGGGWDMMNATSHLPCWSGMTLA